MERPETFALTVRPTQPVGPLRRERPERASLARTPPASVTEDVVIGGVVSPPGGGGFSPAGGGGFSPPGGGFSSPSGGFSSPGGQSSSGGGLSSPGGVSSSQQKLT